MKKSCIGGFDGLSKARPFSTGKFTARKCQVGLNHLDSDKTQGVKRKLLTPRVVTLKNLLILK
jgi:hypothetical protein